LEYRKGKVLVEGASEKLYSTNDPEHNIVLLKNEIVIGGNQTKTVKNFGPHVTAITKKLFKFLEGYNVLTYFTKVLKPNEVLVKNLEMIPVKVILWNFASGSLGKRYKLKEGEALHCPILEFFLNDDKSKGVMINADHACAFKIAKPEEIQLIDQITRKVNAVLKDYFERRKLKLAHFSLEFGRYKDQLLIGNMVSPQDYLLWDVHVDGKLDLDRFNLDKENPAVLCEDLEKRITKS
jgi:phosphoribosylaminoimidazole-succinocarboxamide synthase